MPDVIPVGIKVLGFPVTGSLDEFPVVGRVVGHHDEGWRKVVVDEKPALLVGARVGRTQHPVHALGLDPVLGLPQKGTGGLLVVGTLEKAEEAGSLRVEFVVPVVDDGRDTSHGRTAPQCQKKLALGMAVKGVFEGEKVPDIPLERRHPVGSR